MKEFDRGRLRMKRLAERKSKTDLSAIINPKNEPPIVPREKMSKLEEIADSIKIARMNKAPVIFAFGAHLVKNGLSRIFINLMEMGYVQYAIGNEAVAIHDWELAYQGKTEEDVKVYIREGQFGLWEETGKNLNKAIKIGNKIGLGYGEAVGKFIEEDGISDEIVTHPYKEFSILGNAYKLNVPFGISASIGENITHAHPECDGASLGESSYRDFLRFTETVKNLEGGVYISTGSAIKSPMLFEKALSMARNAALQEGRVLENYRIVVNDIQPSPWDWKQGEPPKDNPAYYLRFFKTFSRMGGKCNYIELDNKDFLHNLYWLLARS